MRKLKTAGVALAAVLGLASATPAMAQSSCTGDCNGDNKVTISEVVTVINIALGGSQTCAKADGDDAGSEVEVNDAVEAVNNAARPGGMCGNVPPPVCGNGVVETGEECDVGGVCGGGSKSGTACTSDADCGAGEKGICDGGTGALRQCSTDAECGGGKCDRCRTFGGQAISGSSQTCSANCTFESEFSMVLKPGEFDPNASPPVLLDGTGAIVHSGLLGPVPLPLGGDLKLKLGKADAAGVRHVALRAPDLNIPPIDVAGLACACVRGVPAQSCGGFAIDDQGALGIDCTPGHPSAMACPANLPCTFVHGAGNSGQGLLGCNGLSPINLNVSQDSNGSADPGQCLEPGVGAPICADPPVITLSGESNLSGSAILVTHTAIGVRTGSCSGFCTDSDPAAQRGSVNPLILTTGTSTALVTGHDGIDGEDLGPYSLSGNPVSCSSIGAGNASGVQFSGVFTSINQNLLGDIAVEILFEAQ